MGAPEEEIPFWEPAFSGFSCLFAGGCGCEGGGIDRQGIERCVFFFGTPILESDFA